MGLHWNDYFQNSQSPFEGLTSSSSNIGGFILSLKIHLNCNQYFDNMGLKLIHW